jgi:hypothetical protein
MYTMTIIVPNIEQGLKTSEALTSLEEEIRASSRDACEGAIHRQARG